MHFSLLCICISYQNIEYLWNNRNWTALRHRCNVQAMLWIALYARHWLKCKQTKILVTEICRSTGKHSYPSAEEIYLFLPRKVWWWQPVLIHEPNYHYLQVYLSTSEIKENPSLPGFHLTELTENACSTVSSLARYCTRHCGMCQNTAVTPGCIHRMAVWEIPTSTAWQFHDKGSGLWSKVIWRLSTSA